MQMKLKKWDQIVIEGKIVTILWIIDDKYILNNGNWKNKDEVEWLSVLNQDTIIDVWEREFFIKMWYKLYSIWRKTKEIDGNSYLIPYLEPID